MIGIGAGPATDGQVLVFHDLLGIYDGHAARFVKRYADVRGEMIEGVAAFAEDVRDAPLPRARARLHDGARRDRAHPGSLEQTGEPSPAVQP